MKKTVLIFTIVLGCLVSLSGLSFAGNGYGNPCSVSHKDKAGYPYHCGSTSDVLLSLESKIISAISLADINEPVRFNTGYFKRTLESIPNEYKTIEWAEANLKGKMLRFYNIILTSVIFGDEELLLTYQNGEHRIINETGLVIYF